MIPEPNLLTNPYVGPRTFEREQSRLFFGREQEARDLLARVVSERLLLFYAQSGAGKSSLLNTRLIPGLQDEGFTVLPVGRVSGELPPGVAQVDNIYLFNLMLSLDRGAGDPGRLAHLSLAEFLAGLTTADGEHWEYVPQPPAASAAAGDQPFVLIIDQFEEIVTSHPGRWREREEFFRQLDAALRDDPNLWVVLTLREDYVAALDPYAALMADRLRARFHMERMSVVAALDAIREPALLAGRPFAAGVAEKLVEDLRQVRVPGQAATVAGQYVEPVQLQVVCYQMWERLARLQVEGSELQVEGFGLRVEGYGLQVGESNSNLPLSNLQPSNPQPVTRYITEADLAEAGNVDRALEQFYADTLAAVLADERVAAAGVSERALRTWFDKELLTETGIRNTVFRNETSGRTGTIPNAAVDGLARRFLLHTEVRAGGAWVELVHDRFVEPIRGSNAVWFPAHLSTLQRQAVLWDEQGHSSGLLLRDAALAAAEVWVADHREKMEPNEQEFLAASRQAQSTAEHERRQSQHIRILGMVAGVVAILALTTSIWGWSNAKLAQDQLTRQAGLALLQEAYMLKERGDALGAIKKLQAAKATNTDLGINVEAEIEDVRRQVATRLVQEGELLAAKSDFPTAFARFWEAQSLDPPPDTPIHVWIPEGWFVMGSNRDDKEAYPDQMPQQKVWVDDYWIQRTEVTNRQYRRCVEAKTCVAPHNEYWDKQQYAYLPVTHVDWFQADAYARWVGGRLPTEAEWEKACRGDDGRIFAWGNGLPSPSITSFSGSGLPLPSIIGSYSAGTHGLYDMSGNVWEWTSSLDWPYPYTADDGRENQADVGPRILRGGAFNHEGNTDFGVSCTVRGRGGPFGLGGYYGFRVAVPSGQ